MPKKKKARDVKIMGTRTPNLSSVGSQPWMIARRSDKLIHMVVVVMEEEENKSREFV